jgi:high-affinity iron transporter
MLSALLVALREGVEAALVVGIVLVYLNRTGRRALTSYVWAGVILAVAASIAAALLLQRWHVSEDGFEGLLMLAAGVLVVTMIVWMNRVARHLKKHIEQRVEAYAQQSTRAAGWGIGFFVFLMVVREGAELVLILRAVELSSAGVQVWIGTGLGIAIAVAVGLFFFQGTLRIPLHRFFAATSTILMVVAFQLLLTGLHELSEAMWLPSSKREMATIGQKRWSFAAAVLCVLVVLSFAADYVYARAAAAPIPAKTLVAENGRVRVPLSQLTDSSLHYYTADVDGSVIRFLVIHRQNGDFATALDACQICGASGYRQEGQNVICRNCGAAIYIPSIGQSGGCNPIAVTSRVEGGEVIVDLSALADAAAKIHS